jgi:hypothetical protein
MAYEQDDDTSETVKNLGVMFLCAVAGYGLAQYQTNRRSQGQICYSPVTDSHNLPNLLADKAEEIIRAGGQAGVRKVGALLELVVQSATGDTQVFRQAMDTAKQAQAAYGASTIPRPQGAAGTAAEVTNVEMFDTATGTWVPA